METFLKKIVQGHTDNESKSYFLRYGKGDYKRRFLISIKRGDKIKVKASFEWANDFFHFVKEMQNPKFSGLILSREKISGKEGRKKAGVFVYEVQEEIIGDYKNVYYYLLNVEGSEIRLKIKKSLPKPGKNEEKIDEGFCLMELDNKYWNKVKEAFFWDVPECKGAAVEHQIIVKDVLMPKNEKDPTKIRELAVRKGTILRKITADGKEIVKEYPVSI